MSRMIYKIASLLTAAVMVLSMSACNMEKEVLKWEEGKLMVHYIDVGQGDCAYIEFPDGKTMLIDAGESENGEKVAEYIRNQEGEKIDFLVGTHPHSDHIGGLAEIVEEFEIGEIYMPKVSHNSKTYENLLLAIKNKGYKIKTAKEGVNVYKTDDLSVDILSPVKEKYSGLNDYSAVIKITYKERSFLFTGDIENSALNLIKSDVSADVLKVAHHGSAYSNSEEFLEKVNPEYAIISVGKGNSYGHPHWEVLQILENMRVNLYRTDEDGTVIIMTDGEKIHTKTTE